MTMRPRVDLAVILSALLLFCSQSAQAGERPYRVTHGNQLDAQSYQGYKLYRNWCARCHGTYGQGLAGPNLAQSLNKISRDEFMATVIQGKTGRIGNMPAWKSNAAVMTGIESIYSYLKARADGAIGTVKPQLGK